MNGDIITTKETKPERKKYVLKRAKYRGVTYKVNYEQELNEAQLEAVKVKEGAVLVIAVAG